MKNTLVQFIVSIVVLFVLIGVYGVWFVAVDMENAKARSLADEIQTKSQDASRIAEAKAALTALAANESSVSAHFVSSDQIVPFLSGLESTGKSLGSKVEVASVGADTTDPKQGHLNLSLSISGSFDSVLRTLGAFEYAPYDIVLTNLTLDTAGSSAWDASVSLSVATGPAASSTPKAAAVTPAPPATDEN